MQDGECVGYSAQFRHKNEKHYKTLSVKRDMEITASGWWGSNSKWTNVSVFDTKKEAVSAINYNDLSHLIDVDAGIPEVECKI